MATDGPTPLPCDRDIFTKGEPVALLDARSNAAERWVQSVAKEAKAKLDWHYSGGIAQVLHLGNAKSRARVEAAITKLEKSLDGDIMRRIQPGEDGLFRAGVTDAPEEAVASFMDPLTSKATYIP